MFSSSVYIPKMVSSVEILLNLLSKSQDKLHVLMLCDTYWLVWLSNVYSPFENVHCKIGPFYKSDQTMLFSG